jgi:SAM-dependent methyltransferase
MAIVDAATVAIYEKAAFRWQHSRGTANDDLGRRFRSQAGDGLVVDLGCGPGRYLDQIGGDVVGLDVSGAMLALARSLRHPLARADLESLPFGNGVFSGAFARHSYLHLPKQSMTAALRELNRVLRPRGFLMLSLIEGEYEGHGLPRDDFPGRYFAFWNVAELRDALAGAGFADIAVERFAQPHGEADLIATASR